MHTHPFPSELSDRPVLIVPGLNNSADNHWQSHWQRTLPNCWRVEQQDWEQPTLAEWTAGLTEAVRRHPGAVLVAHSLGCALVAHYARISGGRGVAGALLVAPADVSRRRPVGELLGGFAPLPRERLPFPSTVVASRNDPYVAFERAQFFAESWGSSLVDLGLAGHVNVASGHGPWLEGRAYLADLLVVAGRQSAGCGQSVSNALRSGPSFGTPFQGVYSRSP